MAHNRDYKPEDIAFPDQAITQSELVSEMQKSYIDYAMSVIVGRALPDVRDGLKPVHRRILYSMYEAGLTHSNAYKKCATAVGDVLGHYHPHGDASVYDALVRLAQDFSMRYPLIDGHGNFGSVDGDPPAAYRYTEARMARLADEMLRDIDRETVDFIPNFDESRKEPQVLPSRFPNLLVNGSSGIAVGMATNIPPHNLREVIDAAICVLDNPDAGLDELMACVQGPDFPTKGIIMGRAGIRSAYATGRGKITIRARTELEEYGRDKRTRIVVTELPYQVNRRALVKNIAEKVKDKTIEEISDLRNESDRNGMRVVIELKRDANPQVVLNKLFSQTQMQTTFSINMLALVEHQTQPRILSLRHILDEYLAFQEEVITRRTVYDLRKARERAHLLEGLLIAQENIEEVIRIIRQSYDNARERLMERFGLDEVQAQAILEMRLRQLQGLDREKLQREYEELEKKIAWYEELLADPVKIRGVLKDELTELRGKYGDERQTEIQDVEEEIDVEDLIKEEDCVYTLSANGYIKRMPATEYKAQHRGGKGVVGMKTREEDNVAAVFTASSHDWLLFFTDRGKVYRKKGYRIPLAGRTAQGGNIINYIAIEPGEKIQAMLHVRDFGENEEKYLFFTTASGLVKRTELSEFKNLRNNGLRALNIREDDRLIGVSLTGGEDNILLATRNGMAICFSETDARAMGRTATGVHGIRLREGDEVVSAVALPKQIADEAEEKLLFLCSNGYGRRTEPAEFLRAGEVQSRGGIGRRCYKLTEKTGSLVNVCLTGTDRDVLMIRDDGTVLRTPVADIGVYGRATQGVRLMRVAEGVQVISVTLLEHEEDQPADEAPDASSAPEA